MTNSLFGIVRICRSLFKGNYLKNEKLIIEILLNLWNFHQIFNSLKKKKIVIANVFPKLLTVKELARALSKKRCFRPFFEIEHVKGSRTLWMTRLLSSSFITLTRTNSENISLIEILNLRSVC